MLKINSMNVIASVFLVVMGSVNANAKEPLGVKIAERNQISIEKINHSSFDRLMKKYVDRDGYVAYAELKASASDREALQDYFAELSRASPKIDASKSARLAFWVNAYNALTIEGILQEYPTTSIRNHTAKVFGYNIWKNLPLIVGGEHYSLDQIEHEILRKMDEPRIHFAIVCASVGCPRLLNSAYTTVAVEKQLTVNAQDFFSRQKNFKIDIRSRRVFLSSILEWFADDFGGSDEKILTTVKPFLPTSVRQQIDGIKFKIDYLEYDWSLNDQARKNQ